MTDKPYAIRTLPNGDTESISLLTTPMLPQTEKNAALRLADELEKEGDSWFRERDEEAAAELRRLHAENEALQKALRRVIRTYRVDDQAWDPDDETERLYQLEIQK